MMATMLWTTAVRPMFTAILSFFPAQLENHTCSGASLQIIMTLNHHNFTKVMKIASSGMFWQFFIAQDKGLIHPDGRRWRP